MTDGARRTRSSRGSGGESHPVNPLVRSAATPPEGIEAEVLDLGRGTPEEFDSHQNEIPGRIVLVRHELMFAPGTIHRRFKYRSAVDAGAVGFLIAGPEPGELVAGSSGRRDEPGIPAAGIAPETARAFRADGARPAASTSSTFNRGGAGERRESVLRHAGTNLRVRGPLGPRRRPRPRRERNRQRDRSRRRTDGSPTARADREAIAARSPARVLQRRGVGTDRIGRPRGGAG